MHDVEHDHPFLDDGLVLLEVAAAAVAAPDAESRLGAHLFSSTICFSSGVISLIGSRRIFIPPEVMVVMIFTFANSSLLPGKSSRKCPPRLSLRSMAHRAMHSETISRLRKSSAVCQPLLYMRLPSTRTLSARRLYSSIFASASTISFSRRAIPT